MPSLSAPKLRNAKQMSPDEETLALQVARLRQRVKQLSRIVAFGLDWAKHDALDRAYRSAVSDAAANRARAMFVEQAQRILEDVSNDQVRDR